MMGNRPLSHSHVERGLKRKRAQHIGQALEPRLVGVKPVVSRSENLAVSPLGAAWRDYQMVSVGRGRKFDKGPSRTRDPWR